MLFERPKDDFLKVSSISKLGIFWYILHRKSEILLDGIGWEPIRSILFKNRNIRVNKLKSHYQPRTLRSFSNRENE